MVAFFKQKMIFVVLQNNDFCKQSRFANFCIQNSAAFLILPVRESFRNQCSCQDKHNTVSRQ